MRNKLTALIGSALDGFRPAVHDLEDLSITIGAGLAVGLVLFPAIVAGMKALFGG